MPYEQALDAVDAIRPLTPQGATLTQFALRWVLMWDAVSTVIPGAKTPAQARENCAAADLPALTPDTMAAVRQAYDAHIRPLVHASW